MAWTAPRTWVAAEVVTAALMNTHVRDNLLETAPAKATVSGSIFVGTGSNAIAERIPTSDFESASETTASTSYTDLATAGPSVTVTTGVDALVFIRAKIANDTAGGIGYIGVDVSGASTIAVSDTRSMRFESSAANDEIHVGSLVTFGHVGAVLTAGSNTFKMQYRVTAGTGTFDDRWITVVPL